MSKTLISVVIPVYNEELNISIIYAELVSLFANQLREYAYEIIFVNDGSFDSSWNKIKDLTKKNPFVRGVCFSRNFGHQIALTAGYDIAKGDAIVTMDADMQHPPLLIFDMVQKWERGVKIVYARRIVRKDAFLKRIVAYIYYRFLDMISDVKIPRNVGDFRLIDRSVLQVLLGSKERFRYLRGMVAWTGFNFEYVDCKESERFSGKTGYTWTRMLRLAFDGITGFSLFPLKLAAFVGVFVVLSGVLFFFYITVDELIFSVHYPLFKWLVVIIYIFIGVLFLLLWLLGEYIGRIFEQQKGRPLYVIDEESNL